MGGILDKFRNEIYRPKKGEVLCYQSYSIY